MTTRIRILMVDDEERFRTTTAKILSRKGFETLLAESGEQALEMLGQKPDVVVLDVKMGGMDGHETLKEIKVRQPDLPVIMLTGHGARPSAEHALETGAFDYLSKPCDIDLLAARVEDAVQGTSARAYVEKSAEQIMIPLDEYTSIEVTSTVREAIQALEKAHRRLEATDRLMDTGHRSVLVFDGTEMVGLLTPLDLIAGVQPDYLSAPKPSMADTLQYSAMFWHGLFTSRVKEIMNRPVTDFMSETLPAIDAEANLMEVAHAMSQPGSRRLVVMRGGKQLGVVREQELFYELARIISRG